MKILRLLGLAICIVTITAFACDVTVTPQEWGTPCTFDDPTGAFSSLNVTGTGRAELYPEDTWYCPVSVSEWTGFTTDYLNVSMGEPTYYYMEVMIPRWYRLGGATCELVGMEGCFPEYCSPICPWFTIQFANEWRPYATPPPGQNPYAEWTPACYDGPDDFRLPYSNSLDWTDCSGGGAGGFSVRKPLVHTRWLALDDTTDITVVKGWYYAGSIYSSNPANHRDEMRAAIALSATGKAQAMTANDYAWAGVNAEYRFDARSDLVSQSWSGQVDPGTWVTVQTRGFNAKYGQRPRWWVKKNSGSWVLKQNGGHTFSYRVDDANSTYQIRVIEYDGTGYPTDHTPTTAHNMDEDVYWVDTGDDPGGGGGGGGWLAPRPSVDIIAALDNDPTLIETLTPGTRKTVTRLSTRDEIRERRN